MTHRESSLQAAKNLYHEAYHEDARISGLSLSREKFDRVIAAGERAATCALERVPASLKAATTLRARISRPIGSSGSR